MSRPVASRTPRALALVALTAVLFSGCATAEPSHIGEDQPYRFVGNVRLDEQGVPGVTISVSADDFDASVVTDSEGKWSVGVPHGGTYEVAIDVSTIPAGADVRDADSIDPDPVVKVRDIGDRDTVAVNFFLTG